MEFGCPGCAAPVAVGVAFEECGSVAFVFGGEFAACCHVEVLSSALALSGAVACKCNESLGVGVSPTLRRLSRLVAV